MERASVARASTRDYVAVLKSSAPRTNPADDHPPSSRKSRSRLCPLGGRVEVILLMRMLPTPFPALNYLYGLTSVRFVRATPGSRIGARSRLASPSIPRAPRSVFVSRARTARTPPKTTKRRARPANDPRPPPTTASRTRVAPRARATPRPRHWRAVEVGLLPYVEW
jgi:hypothetical protein